MCYTTNGVKLFETPIFITFLLKKMEIEIAK